MYLNVLFMLIFLFSLPIIKCQRFVRVIGANCFRYQAIYLMAQMLIFLWTRVAFVIQYHYCHIFNICLTIISYLGLTYESPRLYSKMCRASKSFYLTVYLNGITQFNRNVCLINAHTLLFQEDPDDKLPCT